MQQSAHAQNAYNHPVVIFSSSYRFSWLKTAHARAALYVGLALFLSASALRAQAPTPQNASPTAGGGGILLVLPFDNRTGQPSLEWIREAAPEILSSRFASAGFAPMSRADRLYALDHLGLPQGFQPSRASSLKLAQTLDADSIVVGSYLTDGTGIVAEAQVVDVPHLRMSEPVTARGEMRDLIPVFDSLAWKLTRQLDPGFNVPEETFVAAGSGLRLDAFEQYIRGITEADQQERLRHLNQAVQLSPEFTQAWMALGREDYAGQQYEQAAAAFAKVGGRRCRRSGGRLLSRSLAAVFRRLPARRSRPLPPWPKFCRWPRCSTTRAWPSAARARTAAPSFARLLPPIPTPPTTTSIWPSALKRQGTPPRLLDELAQCLKLRPNDTEAQALDAAWKAPASAPASTEVKTDALERIERNFRRGRISSGCGNCWIKWTRPA